MQTCKLSYIFNSFIGAPPFDTTIQYTTMSLLKNAKSYFFPDKNDRRANQHVNLE